MRAEAKMAMSEKDRDAHGRRLSIFLFDGW
jgi:hypothetical protein